MTNPNTLDARMRDAEAFLQVELRRRTALRAMLGAGVAAAIGGQAQAGTAIAPQFLHGVASGDPLPDRVIIWTRVTPSVPGPVTVNWVMAHDQALTKVVTQGSVITSDSVDYTVKVDVTGLSAAKHYYYGFTAAGVASPAGRTRTLPAAGSTDPFAMAVFSCSIFEKGYFNAYADAATRPGLSAVLHIGDYNYEYGLGGYLTPALAEGLVTEPRSGLLAPTGDNYTLDMYRIRKALYRTDANLQQLHRIHPWITVWDDHESADNSWTGGAVNHDPATEGDWQARKAAAVQAYYEWMPIREPADGNRIDPVTGNPAHMYRSFDIGALARLVMLDTRMAGRNQQLDTTTLLGVYGAAAATGTFDADVQADGVTPRTLMGTDQEAWFDQQITTSSQTWQIVASQVLVRYDVAPNFLDSTRLTPIEKATIEAVIDAQFGAGVGALFGQLGQAGAPNVSANDSWNGYPGARARFYGSLAKAANPVVFSGDSHNAWVANLAAPTPYGVLPIGVEFGGTSVSSPGYEEIFPGVSPSKLASVTISSQQVASPGDKLKWAELAHRGYMLVKITQQHVRTQFVFLDTVFSTGYTTQSKTFVVNAGTKQLG